MATQRLPNGKRAPVEIEEVKTGAHDTATAAKAQLTKVVDALKSIRDGDTRLQICQKVTKTELGPRMTETYDLSDISSATRATRGRPEKVKPGGFERSVMFDRPVLEAVADALIQSGPEVPGTGTTPGRPSPGRDNEEERLVPEPPPR